MKCDANCNSGDNASIFFSYIEDGKIRKVNLCKTCANENGVDDPTGYSLVDLLHGMGEETASSSNSTRSSELTCEACGFSQSDFKKTGRFGCAHCYQVFNEGLESLLEAMHKNTEHAGKVPSFAEGENIGFSPVAKSTVKELVGELDFNLDEFDELDEIVEQQVPTKSESGDSAELKEAMLQDQLDVAISDEDYEEAAKIRDQITNLRKEIGED